MKKITVFCGSSSGQDDAFTNQAYALGKYMGENSIDLIYGGAKIGLMGSVADGALDHNGHVTGILPHFLKDMEVAHEGLSTLTLVETMHERKQMMSELGDGVIALPGGFGTIEELFEMLTWAQLGLHQKPIALLNTNGFYNPLITFIDSMVTSGFLKGIDQEMIIVSNSIPDIIEKLSNYTSSIEGKWIEK